MHRSVWTGTTAQAQTLTHLCRFDSSVFLLYIPPSTTCLFVYLFFIHSFILLSILILLASILSSINHPSFHQPTPVYSTLSFIINPSSFHHSSHLSTLPFIQHLFTLQSIHPSNHHESFHHLSTVSSIYPTRQPSTNPTVHPPTHPSVFHPSFVLLSFVCYFTHLSSSIHESSFDQSSIYPSIHPPFYHYQSIHLYIHPSVYLIIYLSSFHPSNILINPFTLQF